MFMSEHCSWPNLQFYIVEHRHLRLGEAADIILTIGCIVQYLFWYLGDSLIDLLRAKLKALR